jgi:UDP-N-acetylmuramoyl-L-alanyl-D-glutamate--2,6-diaminopimelate ligase
MSIVFKIKSLIKKILPSFVVNGYHFILAFLAALIYGFPSKKIKVIGVTGTNGKSTVVRMTSRILEEAGFPIATSSSLSFKIREKEQENTSRMTMPGRFQIQKFLKKALLSGCKYVILEVTSEGIKQHRHRFIDFDVAVFTNLTPEHIESHGSFKKYQEAKEKLFLATKKIHIINLDDKYAEDFLRFNSVKKYGYGIEEKQEIKIKNIIKATDINISSSGSNFKVDNTFFELNILGRFNVSNALGAICIAMSQGVILQTCAKALKKIVKIPGRMELVVSTPFKVLIDYAFTPNALEKAYKSVREAFSPSQMICVLGSCGGGRDKWKRSVLGKIAAKYCNKIIITNEDPYNENPLSIIREIAVGAGSKAEKILDRREAIRTAIKIAQPGDAVIITGKGAEASIYLAEGQKIDWDDRMVAKEEFRKLSQK